MCGESAGTDVSASEACESSAMCGEIIPDEGGKQITTEPCADDLCGDIEPPTDSGGPA